MDSRFVFFILVLGFVQSKLINQNCDGNKKFVEGHNSRRLLLAQGKVSEQPAASKMNSMIWDKELAAKAAKWAAKNKYGHNPDRTIPSGKFTTGENIYIYKTTARNHAFDLDMAMKSWFDEYKDYNYKKMESNSGGPKTGHYTQMAWSDTIYVGCAVSQFTKDKWNNFYVVCNYGPAGNIIGQTPYKSGKAGKKLTCGAKSCNRMYGDSC